MKIPEVRGGYAVDPAGGVHDWYADHVEGLRTTRTRQGLEQLLRGRAGELCTLCFPAPLPAALPEPDPLPVTPSWPPSAPAEPIRATTRRSATRRPRHAAALAGPDANEIVVVDPVGDDLVEPEPEPEVEPEATSPEAAAEPDDQPPES